MKELYLWIVIFLHVWNVQRQRICDSPMHCRVIKDTMNCRVIKDVSKPLIKKNTLENNSKMSGTGRSGTKLVTQTSWLTQVPVRMWNIVVQCVLNHCMYVILFPFDMIPEVLLRGNSVTQLPTQQSQIDIYVKYTQFLNGILTMKWYTIKDTLWPPKGDA